MPFGPACLTAHPMFPGGGEQRLSSMGMKSRMKSRLGLRVQLLRWALAQQRLELHLDLAIDVLLRRQTFSEGRAIVQGVGDGL